MNTPSLRGARQSGLILDGNPGTFNAITDVPGVEVGYTTLNCGHGDLKVGSGPVRTGVTAILPRGRAGATLSCSAGTYSMNGNGELTGTAWIEEAGSLTTPILLTNTHAVGACHRGTIDWYVQNKPEHAQRWLLPVVGETYDGYLNDINGAHVKPEHAVNAIDNARPGAVAQGSIGGGTGMICYGYKGGNGTSSRLVPYGDSTYTLGAFVQANFGSRSELVITGTRLPSQFLFDDPVAEDPRWPYPPGSGSIIAVIATDAPLLPAQCKALARRVPLGLARTGTTGSHFSGDIFIAFSTANAGQLDSTKPELNANDVQLRHFDFVPWGQMNRFYDAVVQVIEEAVLNALIDNDSAIGRDNHRMPALPHQALPVNASTSRLEIKEDQGQA